MHQVVAAYKTMAPIAPNNKLPKNCDRLGATRLGASKVPNESHDQIIEEIYQREVLEYNQEVEDGADLDSVLSSDEDEDEEYDDASNSNSNQQYQINISSIADQNQYWEIKKGTGKNYCTSPYFSSSTALYVKLHIVGFT